MWVVLPAPVRSGVNYLIIFISKVVMIIFGYRSFEHYLKGNAWRTSLIDTTFFGIGIWMQRIIIADKSNPAMASAMAGIFVGTFIATKLRNPNETK
jgi:putative effector of murein hydrolase